MRLEYFQMIDAVAALDRAAGTIRCRAEVPAASPIFEGHFPDYPLLPGTLMIETIAQAAGLLVLAKQDFARMPLLIQVEKAKIRGTIAPGTALAVECRLVQEGSGYAAAAGRLEVAGKAVAEAEIRLGTLPFPTEQLRQRVREFARSIGLG
jgi:3-hydroxyacyl-[acyl-carrier-protein] dehydratase